MTLREYLQVVRERWLFVTAGLVLGVVAAVVLTVLSPRQYSSTVVLYVASQSANDNTQAQYQGSLLSEQRVKSYTEMITSPRVTGPAAAQVGDPAGASGLGGKVTAAAKPDTVLLTVSVTDTVPERAAAMANAVADVFSRSVATLEQPASRLGPPAVSVQVFEPAVVPTSPASPRPPLNVALGAVLGLLLGLGAAFARHVLDTRITSVEAVERLADAPTLGAIAFDRDTVDKPLILETEPHSPRAEAFRQVRTNLQFVDVEHTRKVIVVTSSLPGEGKSFSASNLSLALRAAGTSVALVEGDLRRPRVADYFGLDRTVGLTSVLTGRASLDAALQPWGGSRTMQVLASGVLPPNPSELLGSRNMEELLAELARRFSVVLVDAPPLLPVTDAAAVGRLCDGAIVVVRHGQTTRTQLGAALTALGAASVRVLGTVVNFVPTTGPGGYAQYGSYYSADPGVVHSRSSEEFTLTAAQSLQSLHTVPLRTVPAQGSTPSPGRSVGSAAATGEATANGRPPAAGNNRPPKERHGPARAASGRSGSEGPGGPGRNGRSRAGSGPGADPDASGWGPRQSSIGGP